MVKLPSRKRPVGQPVNETLTARQHPKRRSAKIALASARQGRRRAYDPILTYEQYPGDAVRNACAPPFPF